MLRGLRDVVGQGSSHPQGVDVVRGLLQDGVVGHEVGGAHALLVGVQVDGGGVRCVAAEGTSEERGSQWRLQGEQNKKRRELQSCRAGTLPFSTLDVGVV